MLKAFIYLAEHFGNTCNSAKLEEKLALLRENPHL